jgi:hypothetical protein
MKEAATDNIKSCTVVRFFKSLRPSPRDVRARVLDPAPPARADPPRLAAHAQQLGGGEKDAELAQELGQLQPFTAILS